MQRSAYVVVDVGAVRRSVGGGLDPGVVVDPDRLTALLAPHGLQVREATLVSADVPLPGAPQKLVEVADALADAQLERLATCDLPARLLSAFLGAFAQPDGTVTGEVAVDGLLVTAALQYAREIDDGRRPDGVVVLLSDDPDVWICHRYPPEVAFLYAGELDGAARREIDGMGGRWLHLPEPALATLLGRSDDGPINLELSSGALDELRDDERRARHRAAARWAGSRDSATIAVVDLADLFRNAIASLGAAEMPGPDAVRRLLARLGLPGPAAAYATVPDLPDELLPAPQEPASIGWRLRDAQFAQAGAAYTADRDDTTHAATGELIIERQPGGHYHVIGQRRLATSVVADAWWAAAINPTAPVAIVSDRWDVVALQWHARALGITLPRRLIRIGTQPSTIAAMDLPHVVVPDDVLAELVHAPASSRASAPLGTGSAWSVEDVSLAARTATLVAVGDASGRDVVRLDRFEDRIAAIGLVAGIDTPGAAPSVDVRRARVIGYREPAAVVLEPADAEGDPVTVGASGPGMPRRGEVVSLVTDVAGRRWFVGEPDLTDALVDVAEPRILVVERGGDEPLARLHDGDEPARLWALPGVVTAAGDVVLAVPRNGGWQAISSDLAHLHEGRR